MSDNTNLVAKANHDSSREKLSKSSEMQQTQRVQERAQTPEAVDYSADNAHDNAHDSAHDSARSINLALGYYAVGELSIGRAENALFAYRLLNELEKNEMRWQLGKAFCALELNLIGEAQETLAHIQKTNSQNIELEQQKLLERCTLRLEYMQKRQERSPDRNPEQQSSSKQKSSGKVTQGKVTQGKETQGKVIPFPAAKVAV